MSSTPKQLIEKFSLAIHGEEPGVVIDVMVSFIAVLCARWKLDPEHFINALREAYQAEN